MLKRSVTGSLARVLFAIVLLSVLSGSLALLTLSASLNDAEAVNIAGSLRMQSYRIALNASTGKPGINEDILRYRETLEAPALRAIDRRYVPFSVRERYHELLHSWQSLQPALQAGNTLPYRQNVALYVDQIDRFVLALQRWAELKMKLVAAASLLGFVTITLLVFWTLRSVRRQVVVPLQTLVTASEQIERAHFRHVPLDTALQNELGVLARTFTRMSGELEKHYHLLEETVREKTRDLRQANRRLSLLYRCSEILGSHPDIAHSLPLVLQQILQYEDLSCISLTAPPLGKITAGMPDRAMPWHSQPLSPATGHAIELRWQAKKSKSRLMQGLAPLLSRSLQLAQAQQKVQHLLLMEERATIARELHDSLAQSLAWLRIQIARLRRVVSEDNAPARAVVGEMDLALNEANRQLRELLTTFRLSIEPGELLTALHQVINPLRKQTRAVITLTGEPASRQLEPQKQIHVLQIVREALLNAIRHAEASEIIVRCGMGKGGDNRIEISDNGCGIPPLHSPEGHYGLSIMQQRASGLNGRLTITPSPGGGTSILLQFPAV